MSLINGIGFAYLGQSAVRSDGSYIATKWFCLALPLIPAGSYRVWPESSRSHLAGAYSSSTFKAAKVPLYWPHVFKFYGMYFAFYMFVVIAGRVQTGAWHFS